MCNIVFRCKNCGTISRVKDLGMGAYGQRACGKCDWHKSADAWLFEVFDLNASTAKDLTLEDLQQYLDQREK